MATSESRASPARTGWEVTSTQRDRTTNENYTETCNAPPPDTGCSSRCAESPTTTPIAQPSQPLPPRSNASGSRPSRRSDHKATPPSSPTTPRAHPYSAPHLCAKRLRQHRTNKEDRPPPPSPHTPPPSPTSTQPTFRHPDTSSPTTSLPPQPRSNAACVPPASRSSQRNLEV